MKRKLHSEVVLQKAVDIFNSMLERVLNVSNYKAQQLIVVLLRRPSAVSVLLTR